VIAEENIATNGRRAWAALIDSLMVTLFVLILFYDPLMVLAQMARGATTPETQENFLRAFQSFQHQTLPYIFSLYVVYHAVPVWRGGMTLGKYLMKIRVVQAEDGMPVSFGGALSRALGRTVGEMFVFYVTFVLAFFTPLRQTLHDRLSRTVVVNVESVS
jgi:uncharacterized RDD family membrane protein YckC